MLRRADATGKMQWVLTFAYFARRNVRWNPRAILRSRKNGERPCADWHPSFKKGRVPWP